MATATRYPNGAPPPVPGPARTAGHGSADMDQARTIIVQEIRERVALDQYVVDADKVAGAIVERLLAAQVARRPKRNS